MKKIFFLLFFSCSAFTIPGQSAYFQISKDSLKILIQTAKEDTSKVNLLIDLGGQYPWSYPDTALQYANQALALAEKLEYKKGIYYAQWLFFNALTTMGNYPLALEYGLKNEALSQAFNDPESKISLLRSLAGNYLRTGEFNNWLVYTNQALALARKSKLPFQEGLILNSFARTYLERNQPDSALYYAKGSYQLMNNWPSQPINIGHAYLQKNMFDSAVYWFRIGLELATLNQTEQDFVDVDNLMALLHKKKNNIDSAIWYSKKALSEKISANYPLGTLKASDLLVSLYESQNKPDSLLRYLRMSIMVKDSLFSREKAIAEQNLLFNKKEKEKELEATRLKFKNQAQFYLLSGGVLTLLIIAFILFRANKQKQKSYIELRQQRDQIDFHKTIAENSLNELKATQSQLIQSEKMASLGQLTAGIAHEIQNPLNFVNNFSEVNGELIEELKSEKRKVISERNENLEDELIENIRENEEKINHHGKRADAIVKNMLQHSRGNESGNKKEPTEINVLANEYFRLAYHSFQSKHKDLSTDQAGFHCNMKLDLDSNLPPVNIIPQDIGRVLLNIFNNSFWACKVKSEGVTSKSPFHFTNYFPAITLTTKNLGDKIEIRIHDNGPGIPQNIIDKIFQPFFTTKPTGQGTGLGLSLAYDIVKAHGGTLNVTSKEGEGAEFVIELPLKTNQA